MAIRAAKADDQVAAAVLAAGLGLPLDAIEGRTRYLRKARLLPHRHRGRGQLDHMDLARLVLGAVGSDEAQHAADAVRRLGDLLPYRLAVWLGTADPVSAVEGWTISDPHMGDAVAPPLVSHLAIWFAGDSPPGSHPISLTVSRTRQAASLTLLMSRNARMGAFVGPAYCRIDYLERDDALAARAAGDTSDDLFNMDVSATVPEGALVALADLLRHGGAQTSTGVH